MKGQTQREHLDDHLNREEEQKDEVDNLAEAARDLIVQVAIALVSQRLQQFEGPVPRSPCRLLFDFLVIDTVVIRKDGRNERTGEQLHTEKRRGSKRSTRSAAKGGP